MPKNPITADPTAKLSMTFIAMFVVNMVVIYIANLLFPNNVVLGNMNLDVFWALVISSAAIALLTVLVMPLLRMYERSKKRDMTPGEMMGVYLIINFVILWLISRAAEVFGLGLSSWLVVLLLAVVLDLVQGFAAMSIDKMGKK